jgi:Uri superfamily endonuclease
MPSHFTAIANAIPKKKGSYALHLRLPASETLQIGRLGLHEFTAGDYIYLGSALGPGGLRGRLSRHLHPGGKTHWHIDYLRKTAPLVEVCFEITGPLAAGEEKSECRWSQALAGVEEIYIPLPGFGASDCRSGCAAHLVALPAEPSKSLQDWLIRASIPTERMGFLVLSPL